ncbi:unnamed protein product, partial [Mesorhabditis belari]|uniref:Uncharacterized protein n=1 Tax=Mesorhabditis belari TaxID=2138241 RepID=A0AAF3FPQ3_9BILA
MEIDDEIVARCKGQFDTEQLHETYERRKQIEESSSIILSVAPAFSITAAIFSVASISFLIWAIVRRRLPNRKYRLVKFHLPMVYFIEVACVVEVI